MNGRLIGVGLGPGDPELVTRKAWRLIENATVVAYPAPEGGESFARSIAADAIPAHVTEIRIDIPMDVSRYPAQKAYDQAARDIAVQLESGNDVVVLCEGDPFFYGSFMYIFSRLSGRFKVDVIPGVTSVTACAAASQRPLSARNEALSVVPGTLAPEVLKNKLIEADAIAVMKVGRHLPKLRALLSELGLTDNATYIERASLPNQRVLPLKHAPESAPYFSMILINKGGDPWLN